ncbi:hypothetical protein PsYK624_064070 [Phanerochaete sordida]|uniref:Uncharacterized protein n=1 Tax=Phanerochaete sordida TaxID=48140 RepID=A0A9P3G8J8_9APHY|nr:hypothetical protein PsYK624_064070 [Phanerochaete sordida]
MPGTPGNPRRISAFSALTATMVDFEHHFSRPLPTFHLKTIARVPSVNISVDFPDLAPEVAEALDSVPMEVIIRFPCNEPRDSHKGRLTEKIAKSVDVQLQVGLRTSEDAEDEDSAEYSAREAFPPPEITQNVFTFLPLIAKDFPDFTAPAWWASRKEEILEWLIDVVADPTDWKYRFGVDMYWMSVFGATPFVTVEETSSHNVPFVGTWGAMWVQHRAIPQPHPADCVGQCVFCLVERLRIWGAFSFFAGSTFPGPLFV